MEQLIPQPEGSKGPIVFYGSESHKVLTRIGFQLSGVSDLPVGKPITVGAPYGQNPNFSTQIQDKELISSILENHCNDPDAYSIVPKWQEEHSAIVPQKTGLAPWMAQQFVNQGLNCSDPALQYLYLSWALHYLEDCGQPLHTVVDPLIQVHHIAYEKYLDDNVNNWIPELEKAEIKDVSNLFQSGWTLAEYVNPYAYIVGQAYDSNDLTILPDVSIKSMKETVGYVAGTIKHYYDLFNVIPKPISLLSTSIITLAWLGVGAAVWKGGK